MLRRVVRNGCTFSSSWLPYVADSGRGPRCVRNNQFLCACSRGNRHSNCSFRNTRIHAYEHVRACIHIGIECKHAQNTAMLGEGNARAGPHMHTHRDIRGQTLSYTRNFVLLRTHACTHARTCTHKHTYTYFQAINSYGRYFGSFGERLHRRVLDVLSEVICFVERIGREVELEVPHLTGGEAKRHVVLVSVGHL